MIEFAGLLAAATLALIASIHVYWALASKSGPGDFVPSRDSKPLFVPSRAATLAVAFALFAAAVFLLAKLAFLRTGLPALLIRAGCWGVCLALTARAVGDFRYIGLFKRVRDTRFGRRDTWQFTPLCLLLAIACGLVAAHDQL